MFAVLNQKWRRSLVLLIPVWAFVIGASELRAADEELFVEEFLLLEDQWPLWEEQEKSLTVEGRFRSMTRRNMTMQQSDLSFKPANGLEFERSEAGSDIVRVRGTFDRDEINQLYFKVSEFEHLPSLEKEYKNQNLQVGMAAEEAFYKLARRFRRYGRFYEEDQLLQQAEQLDASGLETERNRISAADYAGLFDLADRASQLVRGSRYEFELRHAAFRLWAERINGPEPDTGQFQEFLERFVEQMPGAEAPLVEEALELRERYEKAPLEVYAQADTFTRHILNRVLYGQFIRNHLRRQLTVSGSNGMELADRLQSYAPEEAAAIKQFRQAGLKFKAERIVSLTRSEMLEVRKYLLEYGEDEQAKTIARKWLDNREMRVVEEGPAGVPQIAADRVELLGEKKKAIELLLKTVRTYPEAAPVRAELEKQGYAFIDGSWRDKSAWEASLEDNPELQGMRQGFVVEGMTFDQVERTLGYPAARQRSLSARSISEVWVYPQSGGNRLLINFKWKRGDSRSLARVEKVIQ